MSRDKGFRKPCKTNNALAIARWEENEKKWLDGKSFSFISKRDDLQKLVGNGGTLWIIVSRKRPSGSRSYSLSFQLNNCRKRTLRKPNSFGRYVVTGNPNLSTLFAVNDARYLLLSLRFEPFLPIDHPYSNKKKNKKETINRIKKIGQSIQTPRCLSKADIKLLKDFGAEADRWSVFISYKHTNADLKLARKLSRLLEQQGVNIFRDQEALRVGDLWWPTIKRAIGRTKFLILVIGKTTHNSKEVKKEVRHAINMGVKVIPLLAGGSLEDWTEFNLSKLHSILYGRDKLNKVISEISLAIHKIRK